MNLKMIIDVELSVTEESAPTVPSIKDILDNDLENSIQGLYATLSGKRHPGQRRTNF